MFRFSSLPLPDCISAYVFDVPGTPHNLHGAMVDRLDDTHALKRQPAAILAAMLAGRAHAALGLVNHALTVAVAVEYGSHSFLPSALVVVDLCFTLICNSPVLFSIA